MKKIQLIEFLRGYSILTIVIYHYLQTLQLPNLAGKLIAFGGTGVHLFVFLSGFGLFYSQISKPLDFKEFFVKRISKVYIPYILIVIISAIISLIIPIFKNSWYALGGHVFLYKMFDETIMGSYGYPLWFISMIIQFYFVFKLLVGLKTLVGDRWFLIITTIASFSWIAFIIIIDKETERVWNSFFLRYVWEFAIGMVLASKFSKDNYIIKKKISNSLILALGVFFCITYALLAIEGGEIGKLLNDIPALIGYSLLGIWLYNIGIPFLNKVINYTGVISYSFYLLHTLVQLVILYFLAQINIYVALLIALFATYFISDLYHKFVTNNIFSKINK